MECYANALYGYIGVAFYGMIFTLAHIPHRLKTLRDEFDKLESRLSAAERNAASFDAQRKAALSDKHKLQKQVTLSWCTCVLQWLPV